MRALQEFKKYIFADGQMINGTDVAGLREALFDEEGISKEKAECLFEIKDSINRRRMTHTADTEKSIKGKRNVTNI
jgi:hypothetical protein